MKTLQKNEHDDGDKTENNDDSKGNNDTDKT